MAVQAGPYLQAALICERVMRELDGVATVMRVVDRVTLTARPLGDEPLKEVPPVPLDITYYMRLARGDTSEHTVAIRAIAPDGEEKTVHEGAVEFEDTEGAEYEIRIRLGDAKAGRYWFVVNVDGTDVTRSPLTVNVEIVNSPSDTETEREAPRT